MTARTFASAYRDSRHDEQNDLTSSLIITKQVRESWGHYSFNREVHRHTSAQPTGTSFEIIFCKVLARKKKYPHALNFSSLLYWLLVSLCISTRFRFLMQQKVSLISSVEGYRLVFRDSGLVPLSEKKGKKKNEEKKNLAFWAFPHSFAFWLKLMRSSLVLCAKFWNPIKLNNIIVLVSSDWLV